MPLIPRLATVVVALTLWAPGLAEASSDDLIARFDHLSNNGNSNCSMEFTQSIATGVLGGRLQGSCCSPMAFDHYVEQIEGLKAYSSIPEIPGDPYDVDAGLARALLIVDATTLSDADQATFDQALQLAEEGGPCCCGCWRWSVYSGLAKRLIRDRGFDAEQIAEVWDLSSGCGS